MIDGSIPGHGCTNAPVARAVRSHRLIEAPPSWRAGASMARVCLQRGDPGMRCHRTVVLALVACTVIAASKQYACAQSRFNNRYAQNTPAAAAPAAGTTSRGNIEELPMGQPAQGQMPGSSDSGAYFNDGPAPDQYFPGSPAGACGCPDA